LNRGTVPPSGVFYDSRTEERASQGGAVS
jgi:hypothetical protein